MPPAPAARLKGWFQRHLILAILLGCLLLGVLFIGSLFSLIEFSFKNSYIYAEAMGRAQDSAQVIREAGSPLKSGWLILGNVHISGNSGNADLLIPLSGPKGTGLLHAAVKGSRASGNCKYCTLNCVATK
jgi:Cytochrome oxidase complex assembly protein 1